MGTIRQFVARGLMAASLILSMASVFLPIPCAAQESITRRVKTKITPVYPEIARRLGISGTVKLAVVVAPNGSVKNTTVMGGHPVLVNAAMDAVKRWKFESGTDESTGTVEIKFTPQDK